MTHASQQLTAMLHQKIAQAGGHISFADFMATALYHPHYGYYEHIKAIGRSGDFTTAPEISPLFAQCVARQCAEILPAIPNARILELGAGSGRFACDLIKALDAFNMPLPHYEIFEVSKHLRTQQRAYISKHLPPHLQSHITWLSALPQNYHGIIIANEVLDALPVHRFCIENGRLLEHCVAHDGEDFIWQSHQPTTAALLAAGKQLQQQYHLTDIYESEINLSMDHFIADLSRCLNTGVLLLIDYGYGACEYYHPERNRGTLTCFYQHQQSTNPFLHIGEQDITAHVDFTRLIQAASRNNMNLLGFSTQAGFLLGCDLATFVNEATAQLSTADQVNLHHAIKILTLPTEMGERVKVMALGKNLSPHFPAPLRGFRLQDRRRDL